MPDAFVAVRDLVFDYGATRALADVSFDIEVGTVTALVGPNGAGKTTLLRCLATLEQPLTGHIVIDGVDAAREPRQVHRKLGFQQDFYGVYDALTVARNLIHVAAIQGLSPAETDGAVEWAAAAVGLSDRLGQRAGALSRGLRQRLAIARAIVHKPSLLLMDEPASGLDPEARHHLSVLIGTLRQAGMTLIVSSHILAELEDYSTHMMTVRDGRVSAPVALNGAHAPKRRWRVTVLGDPAAAVDALGAVSAMTTTADGIEFDFDGDAQAQHDLLRGLIERGVAVTSFAPAGGHLEKLYMAGEGAL